MISEEEALGLWLGEAYDTLVAWTALSASDPDDQQEGYLALRVAVKRFDPSKGSWTGFSRRVLRRVLLRRQAVEARIAYLDHDVCHGHDRPRPGPTRCRWDGAVAVADDLCIACYQARLRNGVCQWCGVPVYRQKSRRLCDHRIRNLGF